MHEQHVKVWMFTRKNTSNQVLTRLEDFFSGHAEVVRHSFQNFTEIFTQNPELEVDLEIFMQREFPEIESRLVTHYNLPVSSSRPTPSSITEMHH